MTFANPPTNSNPTVQRRKERQRWGAPGSRSPRESPSDNARSPDSHPPYYLATQDLERPGAR